MFYKIFLVFKKDKKLVKKAVIALVVIAALIISFVLDKDQNDNSISVVGNDEICEDESLYYEEDKTIVVDISGAVKNPGIVITLEGTRLYEIFSEVGGLTEDACLDSVNQAAFLQDQQKIYIPNKEEGKNSGIYNCQGPSNSYASLININSASSEALQTLNGVGPVTAQKIIDFRPKNGPFKKIEQLMDVSGIGQKTYDSLKDYITV